MRRVLFKSESVEWTTPKAVYDRLNEEFRFDFDPCPIGGNSDGLATLLTSWKDRRVFCNPPYGPEIRKWLERGMEAELAVYLIPARTDTRWFHELVLPNAKEIRFIRGRLKFGDAKNSAPFPSMIVVFDGTKRASEEFWNQPRCVKCGYPEDSAKHYEVNFFSHKYHGGPGQ